MNQQKRKAFTLVELIVVITILAILGTIAFISFQGYSKDARDSVRVADINNVMKALSLFQIQSGRYPVPSSGTGITYSGGLVWTQGEIGESVHRAIGTLNKLPTDPLTGNNYTYSVLNTNGEYQVAAVMEGGGTAYNPVMNQSFAAGNAGLAYVKGDYNGAVAKVSTGSTTYVLAVPTLISGDITLTKVEDILAQQKFVYHDYGNLPSSYTGTSFEMNGGFDFSPSNLVVYTGDIITLSASGALIKIFTENLQNSYSGTTVENIGMVNDLMAVDPKYNESGNRLIIGGLINHSLGGNADLNIEDITWTKVDENCTKEDIIIKNQSTGKAIQVWAGCNSTIGVGIEYNGNNGVQCGNYMHPGGASSGAACAGGATEKEQDYVITVYPGGANANGDSGVDNIWGKLYTWTGATTSACGDGYHIPTDDEWSTLETYLGCINVTEIGDATRCVGQGWKGHSVQDETENLINALLLPQSGYVSANQDWASARGGGTGQGISSYWAETESGASAYTRGTTPEHSKIKRSLNGKDSFYSSRCIKD